MMDITLLESLRAKSKKEEENFTLFEHTKETIKRALILKIFIERNKNNLSYKIFVDDERKRTFFKKLLKALIIHDLGKINYQFQKRVYGKIEYFNEKDKKEFEKIREFFRGYEKLEIEDHEVCSVIFTTFLLDNSKNDEEIRTAILLHHYNSFYTNYTPKIRTLFENYSPDLELYLNFLISKYDEIINFLHKMIEKLRKEFKNDELIKEVIDEFEEKLNSKNSIKRLENLRDSIKKGYGASKIVKFYKTPHSDENQEKKGYDFFVFLGALRRCDYSASGNVEIEKEIELNKTLYKDLLEKIKKSIGKEEIWQEKILDKNDSNNLILVAPTGSGKTEFALLWAANRGKKLIYTLPLRVALNDLFLRFRKENEESQSYFDRNFVDILHSTSFIEYLKEEKEGKDTDIGSKISSAKIFSSPLLLTTPDQVFLSSLKYYGFDKLINIYPLSTIVIDEIQAYKPEMAAVIIKTMEIIEKLNGNLLIITATFPPYFREILIKNGMFEEKEILDLSNLIKTKQISEEHIKNYSVKRHKIECIDKSLFNYNKKESRPKVIDFKEKLNGDDLTFENLLNNKNKNILIIVNNVNKAIELFKKLEKDKRFKERVYLNNLPLLLHSRVIENEKSKRISAIKKALKEKKKGLILVSTQIVEASVDIDFDILITEISPIDSQIQRWGRIWRNRGEKDYEEMVPNIYIFTNFENDRGTKMIYDEEVIKKTVEVLKKGEKILDYEKERKLIERVFNEKEGSKSLKEDYVEKIKQNLEWLRFYSAEKRSEAQKVFRGIAGIQVFIPNLPNEKDEIYMALCKILKNKNNWKLPLTSKGESIINLIKNEIKDENLKQDDKLLKWKILEALYNYSFNLPIFAFNKINFKSKFLEKDTFKGFFILNIKNNEQLKHFKTYGIDKLKNLDLEAEEDNIL